ncbi:MAG: coproporphyrinogen III oxidase family protein [Synergistaceae bacterium]|nr:coproporphyrinogen III oxidase family protein [Synergistaceae bacterium]
MMTDKKFSLYVHVPFCEKKCAYCSFYSVAGREGEIDSWLSAIELEAVNYSQRTLPSALRLPPPLERGGNVGVETQDLLSPLLRGETGASRRGVNFSDHDKIQIRTLYVGGGTPTVLNISQWRRLMEIIRRNFDLESMIEATSEANPNSLTDEHIKFFRDIGMTRISLGVQSLSDDELKILGRLHDSRKALEAMERVKNSGLSLNCDLIFATPGQTLRTWARSLKLVTDFADHVSTYQLTLEPDTPLGQVLNNDELNENGYKFYRYAQYYLPRRNFSQYEISNFALPGHECRHNIAYWDHSNVIALGPSAVSYVDGVRCKNPDTLSGGTVEREELSPRERLIELAILSLRTKWGIRRDDLLPEAAKVLDSLPRDLFSNTDERIILSPRGMRLGNSIWCELIGL